MRDRITYLPRTEVDYEGRNRRSRLLGAKIGEDIVLQLEKQKKNS